MDEKAYLRDLAGKPMAARARGYMRLTGPGYMQSAMTLGGGSIAGCVTMATVLGYELLWVQPVAIVLGACVLCAVAKQTCHTGEKPYDVFWKRLSPALALAWAIGSLIATILWHIPQYSLTARGVILLSEGAGLNLDHTGGKAFIGITVLGAAIAILYLYNSGARGLRIYERLVKVLVWMIVAAFALAAGFSGIDWGRVFMGITGISFIQTLIAHGGVPETAIAPIVGSISAAVGVNMVFLYPYSLLNKNWGKEYKELAYFDLALGMVLPFILATGFMVLAVATTIGPEAGQVGEAVRDMRGVLPVLSGVLGDGGARLVIGLGMFAVGFSTIITHMLASGFIGCEVFGMEYRGKAKFFFSLLPAVGIYGVFNDFPFALAVTASVLASPLLPIAVIGFLLLLNNKAYMGEEMPRGGWKLFWNGILITSIVVMSVGAYNSLAPMFRKLMEKPAAAVAATLMPVAHASAPEPKAAEGGFLEVRVSGPAMGSVFQITLYGEQEKWGSEELREVGMEAIARIQELEQRISEWIPESALSKVNLGAAKEPIAISGDIYALLELSKRIHRDTQGAFDVTVGPLIELWGFYRNQGHLPQKDELEQARALVGLDQVTLDAAKGTVSFGKEGMRLSFGGIGKGFALDRAAALLRERGIARALLDGGGSSAVALGRPPGRDSFTVRLEQPYNKDSETYVDEIAISDEAFSTSSGLGKFVELDGKKYGHIFDPRTGIPVEGVLSAMAIVPSGAESDALSTAFYVLGLEGTQEYCRQHPEVRAILVMEREGNAPETVRINFETKRKIP
ncbi:MAG: FAD:protein FMN transferase [Candidatus Hydrogenedentes bacterium]|nr:FAD:protein FMN transferase [Candidatus Hydrogenedentota bacterium]